MADAIERLIALFERFPGIGPRQAQRFVQFILRAPASTRRELIEAIQELGGSVKQCAECNRWFAGSSKAGTLCSICANPERDQHVLAIVAGDADIMALERSGSYRGRYFVLGGTLSLASEKNDNLRFKQLLTLVAKRADAGLQEVVLAMPANPEGDLTGQKVREEIISKFPDIRVTSLGRGLSTGSELEYADPDTIKSAFEGRR